MSQQNKHEVQYIHKGNSSLFFFLFFFFLFFLDKLIKHTKHQVANLRHVTTFLLICALYVREQNLGVIQRD